MNRRQFVAASLASSMSTVAAQTPPSTSAPGHAREFYLLRRYALQMGPQTALTERYFAEALIPALRRLALGPVGAFKLDFGPETPAYYLLIPGESVAALASLDAELARDEAFLRAGESFWAAPAASPAFMRMDSTLLLAFEGWPKLTVPPSAAMKAKRIFQLHTYESPSHAAHLRKLEMFHGGEFDIFERTGLHPVFFGDTLIGSRMPSLTYMLTFADTHELEANWAAFSNDPAWKKLSALPRFASEAIVSNIGNLLLSPLSCSQL